MIPKRVIYLILCLLMSYASMAQEDQTIQWLTFEQLEDSLAIKPKKVFIDFYADWCTYCKKMDKVAFKNSAVISKLNEEYYAVKLNAESTDVITFGGDTFVNKEVGKKRNPTHEIPKMLASRNNYPFSLPAVIILNEKFEITNRYFEYLDPKSLLRLLQE